MPDFDLNIWNTNAEAELFAEYQTIAAYDPAEKAKGVLRCGLSTANISQSFVSGRSTTFGPRLLRSMSLTMANTIIYELPAVFVANDRVGAVQVMIGRVVASVAVTLGAECAEEIERVLHDHCERIAASCAASDGEKQAAGNIEVRTYLYLRSPFFSSSVLLFPFFQLHFIFCPDPFESRRLRTVLLSLPRPTHLPYFGSTSPLVSRQPRHLCRQKQHTKPAAMTMHRSMSSYALAPTLSLVLWSPSAQGVTPHYQMTRSR